MAATDEAAAAAVAVAVAITAAAAPGSMEEGCSTVYTVAQGAIFLKHTEDPWSEMIVKTRRPVGSKIYTSGRRWTGPRGGVWAEINMVKSPGELGWVLVEGPGFGRKGPLLCDGDATQLVRIMGPQKDMGFIFNQVMQKEQTVGQLIKALCKHTSLNPKEVVLTKSLPSKSPTTGVDLPVDYIPAKDVLLKETTIEAADIKDDTLHLMYIGHFDEDYKCKKKTEAPSHGGA